MRRATVSIREDLEWAVEAYRAQQEFPPSLAALMNAALSEYLARRGYPASPEDGGAGPTLYEGAPKLRGGPGEKSAAEMVIEDRG